MAIATARTAVRERVRELLGPEAVGGGIGRGLGELGVPVAAPADAEEAAALVRVAAEAGWRLRPCGAGLGLDLLPGTGMGVGMVTGTGPGPAGGVPRADLLVSTRRLAGVTDYEPADLTLRAGAGTTLRELDAVVAPHGQWLPIDPPGAGEPTLGGVTAMGTAGPAATAFGRPRDLVLGMTLVDGRGKCLELGGRVVKNVAGFDLVRLATGSRGALGIITAVSYRLFPRPPVDRTLVWHAGDWEEAVSRGRRLARLPFTFPGLGAYRRTHGRAHGGAHGGAQGGAYGDARPRLALRLLDSEARTDRLGGEGEALLGRADERLEGRASRAEALARSEAAAREGPLVRVRALPDRLGPAAAACVGALGPGTELDVDVLAGAIAVRPAGGDADTPLRIRRLRNAMADLDGSVRVLRAAAAAAVPTGHEDEVGATESGGATPVRGLHSRLRDAFDPQGILPGAWREGWA